MLKRLHLFFKIIWKINMDKQHSNTPVTPETPPVVPPPQPIEASTTGLQVKKRWSKKKKTILISAFVIVDLVIALIVGSLIWYNVSLSPVGSNDKEKIKVTIESGSTPAAIGQQLKELNVIRSKEAFSIYTRLTGTQNNLQSGVYRLSPAETTPEIVKHLTNGNVDTFDITFLPGATVADNKKVFLEAGYEQGEIDAAFAGSYDSPLFASKPAGADLEGYIYGDTYKFGSGATVEEILEYIFSFYSNVIVENDFVSKFQAQGLTLYQGITLASIIQRESGGNDQAEIAEVFYNRLNSGMVLGSDVTYQYIADKTGVERDVNLDSPYNTRRYPGLPPGPIAAPGLAALNAVATPAVGDYLYFLSGDDDVTYFARTNAEHEQNIADHCKVKCSIL